MPPNASTVFSTSRCEVLRVRQVAADGQRAEPLRLALELVAPAGEHDTFAPSAASASAIASPIPEEAPQTIAVRPEDLDPSEQNRRLEPARLGLMVAP